MRTRMGRGFCWGLVGALLLSGQPAGAQPKAQSEAGASAADDASTKRARELFNEGVKAYKKSKWAEAHTFFSAAWDLKKHWQIAANMGDCEMQLGRYREAAEHLLYYAREAPPEKRAEAEAFLKKAQEKVGTITVKVNGAEADVMVDGERVGKTPMSEPIFVEPGTKTIAARAAGMPLADKKLEVAPGSAHDVVLTLEPEKKPPSNETKGPEEKKPPSPVPWIIGGSALAAVGIGMGIGFTVAANGKRDEAASILQGLGGSAPCCGEPVSGPCKDVYDAVAKQDTYANTAIAGFVIGGVAAAGTVATFILWPKQGSENAKTARVIPWVSPRGAGLVGTF
jgi:tetratricopeptide (TPR) repeat protein